MTSRKNESGRHLILVGKLMKSLYGIFALSLIHCVALAAPAPTSLAPHVVAKTPMDKLVIRLRQQNIQIQRDLRSGKLTKDQAKVLKARVEAIRKKEIADLKQNGTKTLTDDQVNQLNQQLNTLSKSIPIK